MVPWSHLRQPFLGWVKTVLTAEFTHFNLVIHLSKSQQSAFRLCTFLWSPAFPAVLYEPSGLHLCWVKPLRTTRNLLFRSSFYSHITRDRTQAGTRSLGAVFFLLMVSGEVKHIVHLIRWNLKAVLCPWGRLDYGPGLAQRTTCRFRSWILSLINCFGFLACH